MTEINAAAQEMDLPHLRQWVGRVTEAEDIVTARLIDQYRATLDPHLFGAAGDVPLALHWCLFWGSAGMAGLGEDGHPAKGVGLPPVPLPRRMWAGGKLEILFPLQPGDRVVRRSTIADVNLKSGQSGPLCFVTVAHEYVTDRGLAIRERQDIVYREAASGPAESAAPNAAPSRPFDLAWTIETTPPLLLRYSALTFNAHRIHYDLPYATGVEFYPGLVVHGPLQASILLNLAAALAGAPPRSFTYRGIAPLIAGRGFDARAARSGPGSIECWSGDGGGQVTMKASADW
jgi:3-methylfumaryl-CoA hydratase